MNRLPDEWLDEAELSLLASGYTPNADLQDCSEWSARQVAEIALTDDLIGMIVAAPRVERDYGDEEAERE